MSGILICDKCHAESYVQYHFGTCAFCYSCFVNIIETKLIKKFLEDLEGSIKFYHPNPSFLLKLKEKWKGKLKG